MDWWNELWLNEGEEGWILYFRFKNPPASSPILQIRPQKLALSKLLPRPFISEYIDTLIF
jgi:hypothetical protein